MDVNSDVEMDASGRYVGKRAADRGHKHPALEQAAGRAESDPFLNPFYGIERAFVNLFDLADALGGGGSLVEVDMGMCDKIKGRLFTKKGAVWIKKVESPYSYKVGPDERITWCRSDLEPVVGTLGRDPKSKRPCLVTEDGKRYGLHAPARS